MPEFEDISPDEPATIENVVLAVMRLRAYDEATLSELISQGRLNELFPFRTRTAELPPDTMDESELPEASPHSVPVSRYAEIIKSTIRSRENISHATSAGKLSKLLSKVKTQKARATKVPAGKATRSSMKIRPLSSRIIVKRLPDPPQSRGVADPSLQGVVVAIGEAKLVRDDTAHVVDVKVGDRILFGIYSGQTVKVKGDELLVMNEEDIIEVIPSSRK